MPSATRSRLWTILRDRYYQWVPLSTRQKLRLSRILPDRMLPPTPSREPLSVHTTPLSDISLTEKLRSRPRIGVVIPTYNQLEQLKLCVGILSWQTMKEFVVVLADDGSDDGTREWVKYTQEAAFWSNRLSLVSGGPHRGRRLGRCINLGVANLPADVWLVLLLSPDVLLHPYALAAYLDWHSTYPNTLFAGRVDWLPPMERTDIHRILNTGGLNELTTHLQRNMPLEQVPTTLNGPEYRSRLGLPFANKPADAEPKPMQREWLSSMNLAYPPRLHWYVGGFDEQMCGAGYEDLDFAERLALEEMEMVGVETAACLHLYHDDHAVPPMEAQRNLDYLIRKYLLHGYPASVIEHYTAQTDWQYWWHYNRERGAEVVSADGTLWVVNAARTHRMQLPDEAWLAALGFPRYEVHVIAPEELEAFENMGLAADPLEDGLDYLRPPQAIRVAQSAE